MQAGPQKDTFIVLHPDRETPAAAPPPTAANDAIGSGKGSAAGSGGGMTSPDQQQQHPYIGTESQDPMLQDASQVTCGPHGPAAAAARLQDQQISQLMTGLSVGNIKLAGGDGVKDARAGVGSVFAKDVHAGERRCGVPNLSVAVHL